MRLTLLTALIMMLAAPISAQTYQLSFGGGSIGTLSYSPSRVASNVTSAPMGVGNGQFEATVQNVTRANGDAVVQYLSKSPAKGRTISVLYKDGSVVETVVTPTGDQTALSDISAVPAGVTTPIVALGHLINATGCPSDLTFYEGRRAVKITATGRSQNGTILVCDMSYRVTHGPGHLSPLFIKNAKLSATYDTSSAQQLTQMSISSGPFTLYVTR